MATPTVTNHDYRQYAKEDEQKAFAGPFNEALSSYLRGQTQKELLAQQGEQGASETRLKDYLQGQAQQRATALAQNTFNEQNKNAMPGQRASVGVTPEGATISEGGGTAMHQGGEETGALARQWTAAVKPYQDRQSQSQQYVQDLLSGNMTGQTLASVGKTSIATGGQAGARMAALIGATPKDFPGKFQAFLNNLAGQEHPDMTDPKVQALGDALMLDVTRNRGLAQQQAQKFSKLAPGMAPTAAAMGTLPNTLASFTDPNEDGYQQITKQYSDYKAGKHPEAALNGGAAGATQGIGNKITGAVNGLAGWLGGGGRPQQPMQSSPNPSPTEGPSFSAMGAPGAQQQAPGPSGGTMRVRHKASGQTGTIPSNTNRCNNALCSRSI